MKGNWFNLIKPLGVTLIMLVVFEVLSTAFFPMIGFTKYRLPFNILIVLYLGFKIENPFVAILILILQYTHSFFSIEGWEMGTIAGVLICIVISYLKDLLHLSSSIMIVFVTQMFQFLWFMIISAILYIKTDELSYIVEKFWRFLPESIVISLMAPILFAVLDVIWQSEQQSALGDSV